MHESVTHCVQEKNAVDLGKLRQEVQQDDAKSKAGQKHSSQVHKYGEQ